MKERIAILDGGYASYDYEQELFSSHGFELALCGESGEDRRSRIGSAVTAAGLLVRDTVIDEEALALMPRLRAIVRYGVGYDNIDVKAARTRGIRVANVQGYANHAVSDHALALLFSCTRGIGRTGLLPFGKPSRREVWELHDKILGIIGIGRIGSTFSEKASPLFRQTLACDPYKTEDHMKRHGAVRADLETLLRDSHVISLHCNLSEETRHLLDEAAFRKMEQRPVIINTARGGVIHERSLLDALQGGKVHSAGLDVFGQEPPGELQRELTAHPLVVATPHVAWYSETSMKELQRRAADHMVGLLTGKRVSDELFE